MAKLRKRAEKRRRNLRKPMPPPTRVHKARVDKLLERIWKEIREEGLDD